MVKRSCLLDLLFVIECRRHDTIVRRIKIISAIKGVILDFKTDFLYFYNRQFR